MSLDKQMKEKPSGISHSIKRKQQKEKNTIEKHKSSEQAQFK